MDYKEYKLPELNWYKIFRYPFNKYGIHDAWLGVKHAWQRAFRGYDDTAYWGLSSYITDIALPVLKHYRLHKTGIPLIEGFEGDKDFEKMHNAWDEILDKMIRAFQLMYDHDYGLEAVKNWKKDQVKIDEGLALFAKYFQGLWD